LQGRIQSALDHVLGIRVRVALVEPHSLERSEGKAKRVIDRRAS
jgi:phenylacetate-CoA ligase